MARERQSKTDHHALVEYDPTVTEYPINSYVLFTPPVGRSDKLLPRHRGPYQVLEKSPSIYVIEDLVNGKRTSTHIHNLRPFAQQNEQEFVVESTNGHRGNAIVDHGQDSVSHAIVGSHIKLSCMSTSSTIICEPMQWRPWSHVNISRWYEESFSRFSSKFFLKSTRRRVFPGLVLVDETPHISVHIMIYISHYPYSMHT